VEAAHIKIRGARKSFNRPNDTPLLVLDGIELDVHHGEFLSILGPSGCGKSTLINILSKQDTLDAGTIRYEGAIWQSRPDHIAVVWQEEYLMPWKTAKGNVEFPLIVRGEDHGAREVAATNCLRAVGLNGFEDYYPSQLSQGMRKRVALAAALVTRPSILLMDEPFAALDVYTKRQVEKELVNLWEDIDSTIVMVTHDVQEAVVLSDRVVVLTGRPAHTKSVREIPLPRPRNLDMLYGDAEFHSIVRELWVELTQ
jgi:NitT/TauT family transport system ATP-binding protein